MSRLILTLCGLAAASGLTSCLETWRPPFADRNPNPYLEERPPRYGHGGTQSPSGRGGPVPPGQYAQSREGTIFLNERPPRQQQQSGTGYTGPDSGASNQGGGQAMTSDVGASTPDPEPDPAAATDDTVGTDEPQEAVERTEEKPYGIPVAGKDGYVYSPFDEQKRFVDVRDISPGTEVRCPYTNKIFRVP